MPSRPPTHQQSPAEKKSRLRDYYKQRADQQKFYNTTAWKTCRAIVLARDVLCKICNKEVANHCDHINPRCNTSPNEWYNPENLQGLCASCHSKKTKSEW